MRRVLAPNGGTVLHSIRTEGRSHSIQAVHSGRGHRSPCPPGRKREKIEMEWNAFYGMEAGGGAAENEEEAQTVSFRGRNSKFHLT